MPELPEVETIVQSLRRALAGRRVTGVEIHWERSVATPRAEEFRAGLLGQRISGVDRRGKFIIVHLERGHLLVHLRMSGRLLVVPAEAALDLRHLRVAVALDGQRLLFYDPRKFGRMYLVHEAGSVLDVLGPEPLSADFTAAGLEAGLRGRRAPIKSLLLDQRFLAGVGNIYADEALHAAGIAPHRPAGSLDHAEVVALYAAIRTELERGIRNRGTTLSDYRDAGGRRGQHREHLRVYGRAGEACLRCGTALQRHRIGGRSSYHCPCCQK